MKPLLLLLLLNLLQAAPSPGNVPSVGAQVFIEPGQTPAEVDHWFSLLEDHGFRYARIRMFGTHMQREDGSWDFSLYDTAFESARRHHIRLFATLFPPTDELTDVGGFKFPYDRAHLEEVGRYVDQVVGHFKDAAALDTWVLQNEPGTGLLSVKETPLSREIRAQWEQSQPRRERDGYLEADFSDQRFLVYYTSWYLDWLSHRVQRLDPVHGRHINPHQVLSTLPEYDFRALLPLLTSMGLSLHYSWHFGCFTRPEYPLGVSMMTGVIAAQSAPLPFWVTEFQGGNVTASGNTVLCPTADEVTQSIWTAVGAGASGLMFWTLNPRRAVREAGEWALLNFLDEPSDRMLAAEAVARCLQSRPDLFSDAVPAPSRVSILYDPQALWVQRLNAQAQPDSRNEGRGKDAVVRSMAAAYGAVTTLGIVPEVTSLDRFDFSHPEGKVAILPHIICVSASWYPRLRAFVEGGGTLVWTGLTGFYDEKMRCAYPGGGPLQDVFGAQLLEWKAVGDDASVGASLKTHLWKGYLRPSSARTLLSDADGVYATENNFGKGKAVWLPSAVDLGCRYDAPDALTAFYGTILKDKELVPVRFGKPAPGVLMRTLVSGRNLVTILVNKSGAEASVLLETAAKAPAIVFRSAAGTVSGHTVTLGPEETLVLSWKR